MRDRNTKRLRLRRVTAVAASIGILAALSIGLGSTLGASNDIVIADFEFQPATITIKQGEVVGWRNDGPSNHTVTADDGSFDSGPIVAGDFFGNTFEKAGTFTYHCSIHSTMKGTVVVVAAAATPISSEPEPPAGTLPPGFNSQPPPPSTVASTPAATASPVPVTTGSSDGGSSGMAVVAIALVIGGGAAAVWFIRRRRTSGT